MSPSSEQRAARKAAGTCINCTKPARDGLANCDQCLANKRASMKRRRETRVHTKPIADLMRNDYRDATLGEIAADLGGLSRERVRQLEAGIFRKLLSRDHRERITWRLDGAISRRKAAREAGDLREELRAVTEVDELLDALDWLEALANGELEALIVERMQQGGELGRYETGFSGRSWSGLGISAWGGR